MCLIAQISSLPSHRVALNHGFQINYNLPYQLSSYYSPIFWARRFGSNSSNYLVNFFEKMTENSDDDNESPKMNESDESTEKNDDSVESTTTTNDEELLNRSKRMIESDLTAGQFYAGLTETLG